jgi:hypothetical protein
MGPSGGAALVAADVTSRGLTSRDGLAPTGAFATVWTERGDPNERLPRERASEPDPVAGHSSYAGRRSPIARDMILEAHAARVVVGTTDVLALLVWHRAFDCALIGPRVQSKARACWAATTWLLALREQGGEGTGIERHARVAVVARAVLGEPTARDCRGQDFALGRRPCAGVAVRFAGLCSGNRDPRGVTRLARGASLDAAGERQRRGEREPLRAA